MQVLFDCSEHRKLIHEDYTWALSQNTMQVEAGTMATNYIHHIIEVQCGNNEFGCSRLAHNMHQYHARKLYFFYAIKYHPTIVEAIISNPRSFDLQYDQNTFQELVNVVACKAQHYSPCAIYSYPHASKLLRNTALALYLKGSHIPSNCIKYPTYQNP